MMRQLEYQDQALETFGAYLDALAAAEARAERIEALRRTDPDLGLPPSDAPAAAWDAMRGAGLLPPRRAQLPYSARPDGAGRPVPSVTFKVPTAGGKTFLAVSAVAAVQARLLRRGTGMVLWIVPNEAIYRQTRRALQDRQHPYRQVLDRAANGRVKLLEKTGTLRREDAEGQLCVMLLMLASAARDRSTDLKLFQDRGDVHGFTPPEGDGPAHAALKQAVPNLDCYEGGLMPQVRDSMGNALRILRPVVVLDEGHRGTTAIANKTLYGFNPRFVLELTATPKDAPKAVPPRTVNVLVEVSGTALDKEGMIKLPINLSARADQDWVPALAEAKARLDVLQAEAERFGADTGRYIRPILLVQVERVTGDAGVPGQVHADDARRWLLNAGLDAAEIAEKTSRANDLSAPENLDLLSPACRVRAIITKAALGEGWDCPFAYVLCSLANVSANAAVTQLIGRILRQPGAERTGVAALDQCYVVARYGAVRDMTRVIADGLERDGLGDLVGQVQPSKPGGEPSLRPVHRRPGLEAKVPLPSVMWAESGAVRPLDYDMDILAALDWRNLDMADAIADIPDNAPAAEATGVQLALTGGEKLLAQSGTVTWDSGAPLDPVYLVRMVSDLIGNPWVAYQAVEGLLAGLRARGLDAAWQAPRAGLLLGALRRFLTAKQDAMAEQRFRDAMAAGNIQWRLRADGMNWMMPGRLATALPEDARVLVGADGLALRRSLFSPVHEDEFSSGPERKVAVYLDGHEAVRWWHRNAAGTGYALQGWRRHRVFPDLIVAGSRAGGDRIVAVETKGDQLAGNLDTKYKEALFEALSDAFRREEHVAGTLHLEQGNGVTVECAMVLLDGWETGLPKWLPPTPPKPPATHPA